MGGIPTFVALAEGNQVILSHDAVHWAWVGNSEDQPVLIPVGALETPRGLTNYRPEVPTFCGFNDQWVRLSAITYGDGVFVAAGQSVVYNVDGMDGTLNWSFGSGFPAATPTGGLAYYGDLDNGAIYQDQVTVEDPPTCHPSNEHLYQQRWHWLGPRRHGGNQRYSRCRL